MEIIDLEMIPGGPKKICHASQYDDGRVIRFNLKENGQPVALSGSETIQAKITKPDGSETTLNIANTSSTYVDLITEADTCDIAGVNHCEMIISNSGQTIGTANFDMKVEEDAYGEAGVTVGEASGKIASFETNIKDDLIECVCEINPKQDLHGYDHPWTGGAGKNKLDFNYPTTTRDGITITNNGDGSFKVNGTATAEVIFGVVANLNIAPSTCFLSGTPEGYNNALFMDCYGSGMPNKREYGNGVSFDFNGNEITVRIGIANGATISNAVFKPMIEQGTDKTAFEPYSNVCPISGFTEMDIIRAGKNFTDISDKSRANEGYIIGPFPTVINSKQIILPPGHYTFSFTVANAIYPHSTQILLYKNSVLLATKTIRVTNEGRQTIDFTIDKEFYEMLLYSNSPTGGEFSDFQLELGEQATDYEPSEIIEKTIQLGQTVYGGKLTCKNGQWKFKAKKGFRAFNGSETWSAEQGYINRFSNYSGINKKDEYSEDTSNLFKTSLWGTTRSTFAMKASGAIYVTLDPTAPQMTVEAFKAFLANTPLQICYELASPIEIDLTAEQVETIIGKNNVYHTANGETAVKFYIRT